MDKIKDLVSSTIEELKYYADFKRIAQAQTNHPTNMTVMGVKLPDQRKVLKEIRGRTEHFDYVQKMLVAKALIETHIHECQYLAYEFIGKDKMMLDELRRADVLELGKNLDNWVSVDSYGLYLTGYAFREGILSKQDLLKWLDSDNFWIRRLALVSTIPLNLRSRGGTGDPERTLFICQQVVGDKHELVAKGLSWALRELAKVNAGAVADFITENKKELSRIVVREVMNKIHTGRKN